MPQTIDNMSAIWSNSLTTYTFLKTNITGPDGGAEQSAAGSLLMDLQVGGSSRFRVNKDAAVLLGQSVSGVTSGAGVASLNSTADLSFYYNGTRQAAFNGGSLAVFNNNAQLIFGASEDTRIRRRGAANIQLGSVDAAAPVAQTLSVQSGTAGASALSCSISGTTLTVGGAVTGTIAIGHAVTGTGVSAGTVITAGSGTSWTVNNSQTVSSTTMYFNSVGQNFTITGSQGSGPSAGGSIVFQVAPAGSAATTAQNALATALTIGADRNATFGGNIVVAGGAVTRPFSSGSGASALNILSTHVGLSGIIEGSNNVATFGFGNSTNTHNGLFITQSGYFGWYTFDNTAPDLRLFRDASNTLALRNGANAQELRVYGSYTSATVYDRLTLKSSSTVATIAAETDAGDMDLALTPAGSGNVRFGTHTGTTDTAVSGYIEIKDAGGTIRKLAVIT